MTNKKYIAFAEENTVEVICENRLQEALDKKERNAQTFEGKRGEETVQFMIEWPNLTSQELLDLDHTPAAQYNQTGKIPYTSLVDPFTLKQEVEWRGGVSADKIMDAALELRKKMTAEHGPAISRKDLKDLKDAETSSVKKIEAGDYAGAMALVTPLEKKADKWQADQKAKLEAVRTQIVAAATEALDAVAKLSSSDPATAKGQLAKLLPKLKGTGLEPKAQELQATLKG